MIGMRPRAAKGVLVAIALAAYLGLCQLSLEQLRARSAGLLRARLGPGGVALVTAHPDDELLFFGPTLLSLLEAGGGPPPLLLCLSGGPPDGPRRRELAAVARALGLPAAHLRVAGLPDGHEQRWPARALARQLARWLGPHANLSAVLTFDRLGVSGHPNHVAVHEAAHQLAPALAGRPRPVRLLQLRSRPTWRKYLAHLEAPWALWAARAAERAPDGQPITLSAGWAGAGRLRSLMRLHESQMLWFRYLYMAFSRYMFINELELLS